MNTPNGIETIVEKIEKEIQKMKSKKIMLDERMSKAFYGTTIERGMETFLSETVFDEDTPEMKVMLEELYKMYVIFDDMDRGWAKRNDIVRASNRLIIYIFTIIMKDPMVSLEDLKDIREMLFKIKEICECNFTTSFVDKAITECQFLLARMNKEIYGLTYNDIMDSLFS